MNKYEHTCTNDECNGFPCVKWKDKTNYGKVRYKKITYNTL